MFAVELETKLQQAIALDQNLLHEDAKNALEAQEMLAKHERLKENRTICTKEIVDLTKNKLEIEQQIKELTEVSKSYDFEIDEYKKRYNKMLKSQSLLEKFLLNIKHEFPCDDRELNYEKQIKLHLLKLVTKLHLSQDTQKNTLKGFSWNPDNDTVHPFFFELNESNKDEIKQKLWKMIEQCNSDTGEWKVLFNNLKNEIIN